MKANRTTTGRIASTIATSNSHKDSAADSTTTQQLTEKEQAAKALDELHRLNSAIIAQWHNKKHKPLRLPSHPTTTHPNHYRTTTAYPLPATTTPYTFPSTHFAHLPLTPPAPPPTALPHLISATPSSPCFQQRSLDGNNSPKQTGTYTGQVRNGYATYYHAYTYNPGSASIISPHTMS